jgi:predicted dehydrogenase
MADLIELCKGKNIVAAPSCTMRFHPAIKKIKELVDAGTIGPVLTFIYHVGMYLPDWHPWEDYRTFYVSKKETGACREIVPYELGWITWVMGDITDVSCMRGKLTALETDIDDAYQLLMKFEKRTLGHMLVDAISRVPYRSLRLISEEGVITWEWGSSIRVYTAKDKTWREYSEYPEASGTTMKNYDQKIKEEPYIEEMKRFVDMIANGAPNQYTLSDDAKILHILESAEKSSDTGNHINLLGVSGE